MGVFLAFFGICCLIVLVYHAIQSWLILVASILLVLSIFQYLWRILD